MLVAVAVAAASLFLQGCNGMEGISATIEAPFKPRGMGAGHPPQIQDSGCLRVEVLWGAWVWGKRCMEPLIICSSFPWRKGGFSSLQPDIFGCQMV